ncbi:hypothetical protein JCM10212_002539 [Sporobolomyces blumeae]
MDAHASANAPPSYSASLSSPLVPTGPSFNPASPFNHVHSDETHLPSGMFILKNRAHGKALDLLGHKGHDGAPLGCHPVKHPVLRGLNLQNDRNNQLFFLDWNGHLVSAAVSRQIDARDDQLVVAHPRPVQTYPSPLSHPPPRFHLDPATSTLQVVFSHDPTYPPPLGPPRLDSEPEYDYLVEVVPVRSKAPRKDRSRPGATAERRESSTFVGTVLNSAASSVVAGLGGLLSRVNGGRGSVTEDKPTNPDASKRLPRDRDASLPPPPPPSKDSPPLSHLSPALSASPLHSVPISPMTKQSPRFPEEPNSDSPLAIDPASFSPSTLQQTSTTPHATALNGHASESDSDSDSEPSAFRPVRVVRLVRSEWRATFPYSDLMPSHPSRTMSDARDRGMVGLGFGDEDETGTAVGDDVENVWPESVPRRASRSTFSSSEGSSSGANGGPGLANSGENRTPRESLSILSGDESAPRKDRKKGARPSRKELRMWRRRQWDVVPVTVRPVDDRLTVSGRSARVTNDLEDEMYGFSRDLSDDDDERDHTHEAEVPWTADVTRGGGADASRTLAQNAANRVGSFLSSTTAGWWGSANPPLSTAATISSTPTLASPSSSKHTRLEDEPDAEEVGADEIERLARPDVASCSTRNNSLHSLHPSSSSSSHSTRQLQTPRVTRFHSSSSSVRTTRTDLPAVPQESSEGLPLPPSPPLPDLPSVTPSSVPLPPSVPTSPVVD